MKVKQLRDVLAYLGVEYGDQPTKLGELKFVMSQMEKIEPEKYAAAVSVIIDGAPAVQGVPQEYESEEAFIKQRTEHYENESVKNFADRISGILETLRKDYHSSIAGLEATAEQVWREEANKHKVIVVEQSRNGKHVEMKGVLPDEFEDMLALADERENIMMVGPAGSGKTYLAGQLAIALDLPFATQSCSAGISESAFSGWLLPTGEGGNFEHNSVPFLDTYENGGVFLFDEFDASDPNTLTFLNQALANGGFDLPQRIKNTHVVKHPDFIAVAACNTFGGGADAMYHARNALDGATLDRFKMGMTTIDYSDRVEEQLINEDVLMWGRNVRQLINKHNLKRIMSTRVLIGASKMHINKKWPIAKICDKYFQDWSKEEIAMAKSAKGIFDYARRSKESASTQLKYVVTENAYEELF